MSSSDITQHHVQSLIRYANAMTRAGPRENWGTDPDHDRTEKIRELAERMSQFSKEGAGTFSQQDEDLLTDIGDALVREANGLLNHPGLDSEAKAEPQFRLGLGAKLLEARDAVRKHVQ